MFSPWPCETLFLPAKPRKTEPEARNSTGERLRGVGRDREEVGGAPQNNRPGRCEVSQSLPASQSLSPFRFISLAQAAPARPLRTRRRRTPLSSEMETPYVSKTMPGKWLKPRPESVRQPRLSYLC